MIAKSRLMGGVGVREREEDIGRQRKTREGGVGADGVTDASDDGSHGGGYLVSFWLGMCHRNRPFGRPIVFLRTVSQFLEGRETSCSYTAHSSRTIRVSLLLSPPLFVCCRGARSRRDINLHGKMPCAQSPGVLMIHANVDERNPYI